MEYKPAYIESTEDGGLRCGLCPHVCEIGPGECGDCLTRCNIGGRLESTTYGRLRAVAMDPVEKKPLFHYRPGSVTFSIASAGCNLTCPFCQNHSLSQALRDRSAEVVGRSWSADEVVEAAVDAGSQSISFTYSEPILAFEFARDVAALAKPRGVEILFVTNGQANAKPARELAGFVSAANVDLKCFTASKYKDVLGGNLAATGRTIEIFAEAGVWVEVTTLVIPGFNDGDDELQDIARFIKGVDPRIPWHVSRFHPDYLWLDRPPTPAVTLKRARDIGLGEGLQNVYVGNLPGDVGEKTFCPQCGEVVIDRSGYRIKKLAVASGACASCGGPIAGMGLP